MAIINMLSIDVEDYFQVSAFEKISPPESWGGRELRVEANTDRILSILDEYSVKATFFVLGWVAERCPELVQRIAKAGHEIASHGYGHQRVGLQTREAFREDVRRSKRILEDLCGQAVVGYRAPSYSISRDTFWAFDELLEAGYRYDSSIFPIRHDFYGIPDWPRFGTLAIQEKDGKWQPGTDAGGRPHLHELPITTLNFAGKNLPIAGGGYFRLLPYEVTRWGLQRVNEKENKPFVFYIHPWELDPSQPRFGGVGFKSHLRHYLNLNKTEKRFRRLLADFSFSSISEIVS